MTSQTRRDAIIFGSVFVLIQLSVCYGIQPVCNTADKLYVRETKGYCEGLGMADSLSKVYSSRSVSVISDSLTSFTRGPK
jgi:hypothetical protein